MFLKKVDKIILLLSSLLLALALMGCNLNPGGGNPGGGGSDGSGEGGPGSGQAKGGAMIVSDNDNRVLGKMKSLDVLSISFITSKGHYVHYNWDGTLLENGVYFSELNGGGTPFYHTYYPGESDHQLFYANGKLYRIKSTAPDGSAIVRTDRISYKSRWDSKLQSYGAESGNVDKWVELVEATLPEVGVPTHIALPFSIKPVKGSSIEVRDGNNSLMGYCFGESEDYYLQTSTGYILSLSDKGEFTDMSLYFTGANGSGTPLYHATKSVEYGKIATLVDGKFYRVKSTNLDETARIETRAPNCQSRWDSHNNKYSNELFPNEKNPPQWIEYIETTPADLGLPATIKLPLSFKVN